MARQFKEDKIIVASHNKGKVREIKELLEPYGAAIYSAADLQLDEPEETGDSFIANAELKALAAAKVANMVALADDSGLVIPALNGQPGIYSARWAIDPETGERDFDYGMEKLHKALLEVDGDRKAYFACALTLAWPDGHVESVEGRVYGDLVWPARGENGFGYDPIFVAEGYELTFGEMEAQAKHGISHRADAFTQLIKNCF